jgi:hypothetical protein
MPRYGAFRGKAITNTKTAEMFILDMPMTTSVECMKD